MNTPTPDILKARRARAAARRVTTAATAAYTVNFSDVARRHRKNKHRQKERPIPAVPPIKVTAGQPDRPAAIVPGTRRAGPATAREWTAQLNSQTPSRSTEDMTDRNDKFDRDARAARDAQDRKSAEARAEARAESNASYDRQARARDASDGREGEETVDTSAPLDHASNKERAARQDGSRSSTAAQAQRADESDAVDAERARAKAADKPFYVRLEQGEENVVLKPSYQGGAKEDRSGQGTVVESPNTVTVKDDSVLQIKTGGAPGDKNRDLDSEQPARKFSSGKPFKRAERRSADVEVEADVDVVEDDFDGVDDGR